MNPATKRIQKAEAKAAARQRHRDRVGWRPKSAKKPRTKIVKMRVRE